MGDKIRIGLIRGGKDTSGKSTEATNSQQISDWEKYEVTMVQHPGSGDYSLPDPVLLKGLDAVFPLTGSAESPKAARRLQCWMELLGVPSAGPGLRQGIIDNDRSLVRRLMAQEGLPQSMFRSFTFRQWERNPAYYLMEIEVTLGYPCRILPAEGPSGPGGGLVHNRVELEAALVHSFTQCCRVVAEEWVSGRELAVAMLAGAAPEQSSIGELKVHSSARLSALADAAAASGNDEKIGLMPAADLLEKVMDHIGIMARQVCEALDATGAVLLHFVESSDTKRILLDSVELDPDLGPQSIYAGLWALSGIGYSSLTERLIELAQLR